MIFYVIIAEREMKKNLILFITAFVLVQDCAVAAITVKKAAPVATKQASATDAGASLIPTVVGLVSGVKQLTQQQKQLTAECVPTSQEVNFVNDTMKEWAKTGAMTADEVERALGMRRCSSASGGYQAAVRVGVGTDNDTNICYDWFGGSGDEGMIWYKYPVAVSTYYCTDGSLNSCSEKYRQYVSNIYDVFNLIDFSTADYTAQEATMAAKLISKIENCSYAKLNAKKRAMWGEFLTDTISNMGQNTNTGAIMQAVGGVTGGGSGALQSLGGIAAQFLDK